MVTGAQGDVDAPTEPADVVVGVDVERARQQLDRRRRPQRSDAAQRPDRARPRSRRPASRAGTLNAFGFDLQRIDRRQPAERASRLSDRVSRRGGRTAAARARSTTTRCRWTAGTTCRSANGRAREPRCRSATSDRSAATRRTCRSRRSISSAARRASAAGAATRSARSASGLPIGGNSMLGVQRGAARGAARQRSAACCSSTPATSGPTRGAFDLRRSALRVGPGLRYQTPVGPIRFDVGYQLNPIPGLLVNGSPQTRRWRLHFSIGQAF